MSLKSIRTNYSNLVEAFEQAGIKLNESQKNSLDTFIVALESKIQKMKESTVKATKRVVVEHLDKQYKKIFESILNHQLEHSRLVGKIQNKINLIKESNNMSRKIDNYLSLYVEDVLPEKTIVDYDRMNKLEKLHESLKDMLLVTEDDVEAKKEQLQESFNKQKSELETQIAKLQVRLNESMEKTQKLSRSLDQSKAKTLLESKLADIPSFEARCIRKRLEGASVAEINSKFSRVLESVKTELKEDKDFEDKALDEEIEGILEKDDSDCKCKKAPKKEPEQTIDEDDCDECDPTKGSMHNMHIPEEEEDIQLNESEKIDSNLMAYWCQKVSEIETKGY